VLHSLLMGRRWSRTWERCGHPRAERSRDQRRSLIEPRPALSALLLGNPCGLGRVIVILGLGRGDSVPWHGMTQWGGFAVTWGVHCCVMYARAGLENGTSPCMEAQGGSTIYKRRPGFSSEHTTAHARAVLAKQCLGLCDVGPCTEQLLLLDTVEQFVQLPVAALIEEVLQQGGGLDAEPVGRCWRGPFRRIGTTCGRGAHGRDVDGGVRRCLFDWMRRVRRFLGGRSRSALAMSGSGSWRTIQGSGS
jgi:hypothetical protein